MHACARINPSFDHCQSTCQTNINQVATGNDGTQEAQRAVAAARDEVHSLLASRGNREQALRARNAELQVRPTCSATRCMGQRLHAVPARRNETFAVGDMPPAGLPA
jgi:hypothetical protein